MAFLCIGGSQPQMSKSELQELKKRNDEIELEIMEERANKSKNMKLLLLGSGECGKSTILKQMKLMHNQMTEADFKSGKSAIYSNIIDSMGTILKNMKKLGISFDNSEREVDRSAVYDVIYHGEQDNRFTPDVFEGLVMLWEDAGVQKCYEQRGDNYHLMDCAKYFLDSLHRVYPMDYVPTSQDLLYARRQTTGIVQIALPVVDKNTNANITLRVFDVGGQRTERRKWIHCFDDVNSVMFITAVSEFDQVMAEDLSTNRMTDSIQLFQNIVNSAFFRKASIILFLNKIDLFREKLEKNISINKLFTEYEGGQDYEESLEYIKQRFMEGKPENKQVYTYPTCATDSDQAQKVIETCTDMIASGAVQSSGLE